ncbi:hypothetical protein [Halorubrum aethiopicum]|uniref:hypothetical protein n=1 Tax=Halorubrum aethiopicum TaxID=1758255 RepID=UPI000832BF16|nr:hypothetical protein [Halorubrum aethiopicum]
MGLLTEIRERIGGLLGGSEEADTDEGPDEETESEPAEPDDDRLDPAAATETRSAATDDAVDKLREVRAAASAEETESDDEGSDDEGSDDEGAPLAASDDPPGEAADTSTDPAAGDGKR